MIFRLILTLTPELLLFYGLLLMTEAPNTTTTAVLVSVVYPLAVFFRAVSAISYAVCHLVNDGVVSTVHGPHKQVLVLVITVVRYAAAAASCRRIVVVWGNWYGGRTPVNFARRGASPRHPEAQTGVDFIPAASGISRLLFAEMITARVLMR